jgi:hypothetical protein
MRRIVGRESGSFNRLDLAQLDVDPAISRA